MVRPHLAFATLSRTSGCPSKTTRFRECQRASFTELMILQAHSMRVSLWVPQKRPYYSTVTVGPQGRTTECVKKKRIWETKKSWDVATPELNIIQRREKRKKWDTVLILSIDIPYFDGQTIKAAILIQRWYRQYVAQMEVRRRCTWNIFQSIEYAGEQDRINLHNFFSYLMDHFTPACSQEGDLISHIFTQTDGSCKDAELDNYFDYKTIEVTSSYAGPHLCFPLTPAHVTALLEAFKQNQQLHACYVLQLLNEARKHLKKLPNITHISTSYEKEITICGDLHGKLEDLFLVFYKNGLPSPEKVYVFNGDYVDRGKHSIEILLILLTFLLVYPKEVHLNRGNHEDHIMNLRYGFTKEVMQKYKVHGKRMLKLIQSIFSWLPLATIIDEKILITHGGISETTDLDFLAKIDRHKYISTLRPPKRNRKRFEYGKQVSGQGLHFNGDSEECMSSSCQTPGNNLLTGSSILSYAHTYKSQRNNTSALIQVNKKEISKRVRRSVEEELEKCRRQVGFGDTYDESKVVISMSDSDSESYEPLESDNLEWNQVVDILWSDPMHQEGCVSNTVRGAGCYFGPDVTEKILKKHNLLLLIRSHECKQEGYEFCHNRKVLTIFSASNYYEVGSNRGAYVKLGPDLIPHIVQYQANKSIHKLTLRQRVSKVETSALRALREKIFTHKSELISAFELYDKRKIGKISLNDWATAMESILRLGLPWRVLRSQLVPSTHDGLLQYCSWFDNLAIQEPVAQNIQTSLLEKLYRNRTDLETIFRIIDSDHSGLISFEEFQQTWKLLSSHLKVEVSDKGISDLARSIDFNKDGNIDINEFLEAFRLVDKSHYNERDANLLPAPQSR
ncbi:serine/threonine-protein phosphatase with EF-hands 2 [Callorhinchus milii]|uniref:serine/threonine-protein phosphatase with EF-hands 2 n=1 Tax=Callorhinchus milii TaxID=7868 RepID=UPI001C3F807B|nr:serine/threonine-protein phosphatase with EF-hands 2 [Callorhinchus milii]